MIRYNCQYQQQIRREEGLLQASLGDRRVGKEDRRGQAGVGLPEQRGQGPQKRSRGREGENRERFKAWPRLQGHNRGGNR